MRWRAGRPVLGWSVQGRDERRESAPTVGRPLAFACRGGRRCLGVWRGGRHTECPRAAEVPARGARAQCPECARIDRSYSVAADTAVDDPRPYGVYLAYFGPGLLKVGITAVERGPARLLEQGAVAFVWLGRGPLMAARRAEAVLGGALGVPDRVPYARKRAVRGVLPEVRERLSELRECHARVGEVEGWPESLSRLPFEPVDHSAEFGLPALESAAAGQVAGDGGGGAVVRELAEDGVVGGRLLAAAGPDLHLWSSWRDPGTGRVRDGVVVVDTRLMSGWGLVAAEPDEDAVGVSVPVVEGGAGAGTAGGVQGGLF
ncbi:hypothetical protein DSC45_26985 [Streptomyces sp. YIM 130001]|uniref:DUF2797 domain-containing protein n=1 Tax=Streptomyces sp. YIM 130001 TaxID=2259644 RepID=UPI000E64E3C3|nr:DUF2797 domain-containing protein [Streptomyces sp. YIM 130001]RII11945.1 hypothetical protein DSC45_26985 [Streptomyces sp. YIM 130001]